MSLPLRRVSAEKRQVIRTSGLTMRFGSVVALSDVSVTLEGPQVIALLGPNGAGKTTLIEILEGLRAPSAGSAWLFGEPLSLRRYPRRRIGAVLQREFVPERIPTLEYARLFAAIYETGKAGVEAILRRAELHDRAQVPVEQLSGGEAQRLFIAAASVHDPELLFLDEPTAQLDPENRLRIGTLLRELGKTCTVLITTHDLREAERVADTTLFLVGGAVRKAGPTQELIDSVPGPRREGEKKTLEDAFFHYCGARLEANGALR
jgi:ABC-2 type transport system ATP-binding protein